MKLPWWQSTYTYGKQASMKEKVQRNRIEGKPIPELRGLGSAAHVMGSLQCIIPAKKTSKYWTRLPFRPGYPTTQPYGIPLKQALEIWGNMIQPSQRWLNQSFY